MINKEKMEELDRHWKEIMVLARENGFIIQAYGGTATLATHKNQLEELGEDNYLYRQKEMFQIDMS